MGWNRLGIDRGELRDVAVALLSAERVAYDDQSRR